MMFYENASVSTSLSSDDLKAGLTTALDKIGNINTMLIVPPDITRIHSRAGEITRYAYQYKPESVTGIIPALGTHCPMDEKELTTMFGDIPQNLFMPHDWRHDCVKVGEIPAKYVSEVSQGQVNYPISVFINKILLEKKYDCIISISQVVPHEVAGMAGFSKNIIVGLGGSENIHKSHFLGAAFGMERIMGRSGTPVRKVFNYAAKNFLSDLPIVHVITVHGPAENGKSAIRGLFIGNDSECFLRASELSQKVNITLLEKRLKKVVVYLDPLEYKSTWLGNKSVYRTRMAIDDGGELVVMAPGVKMFGEDPEIDKLIRQFGYKGTPQTMKNIETDEALKNNLSAAAHLIHGSSEGRFSITYCAGGLTKEEIEGVGFHYASVDMMMKKYDPKVLKIGKNIMPDGEEVFFIPNPGVGLWAWKEIF